MLAMIAALTSCGGKDQATAAPPVAVELEKVKTGDITRPFVLFGRTEAQAAAVLSFQVAGVVDKVPVQEGDFVTKTAVLASLDKESLQLNVALSRSRLQQAAVTYRKFRKGFRRETIQQYFAQYKQAQAVFEKAKRDWERGQKLFKSGTISQAAMQGYKTSHASARAAMERAHQAYLMHLRGYQKEDVQAAGVQTSQAKTQLKLARKQLKDTELRAPFSGVVARKLIEVGELVSAQRQAFELMDLTKLKVQVGVPERIIEAVYVGQTAYIAVVQEERPELRQMIIGKIDTKGVALDKATLTYPISITIKNPVVGGDKRRPAYRMLPGKVVRIVLFSKERKQGVTLPLSAVLHDGNKTFVFVNDSRRAKKVRVQPGKTYGNRIVVSGLTDGTEVVVKGQHQLSSGHRLYIVRSTVATPTLGPKR
jgi:RND family efflux transporter MFP subunit